MSYYTATWNMKGIRRGDTLKAFSVVLKTGSVGAVEEGTPIVPAQVCCQIRDHRNHIVYSYSPAIGDNGRITFPSLGPEITQRFRAGTYKYDVEFTFTTGTVRTYLTGTLRVTEDISKCR